MDTGSIRQFSTADFLAAVDAERTKHDSGYSTGTSGDAPTSGSARTASTSSAAPSTAQTSSASSDNEDDAVKPAGDSGVDLLDVPQQPDAAPHV